jgi:hypothetical protein
MTERIVEFLSALVATVGDIETSYCLAERRTINDADGKTTEIPYIYQEGGNYTPVEVDSGSVSYWRLGSPISFTEGEGYSVPKPLSATYPLRFFAIVNRDNINPLSYSQDVANILQEENSTDLRTQLGAKKVKITVNGIDTDTPKLWREEFKVPVEDLHYTRSMIAIDVTVNVVANRSCWENCDNYPDILQGFSWCSETAETVGRLTPEQIVCVEDYLCEVIPCEDATLNVNGVEFDTIPSGDTYPLLVKVDGVETGTFDVPNKTVNITSTPCADATVENSDASYTTTTPSGSTLVLPNINFTDSDGITTSVPSVQNIVATPIPPCADATIELNGVEMTTIPSGDTENISVRQSSGATEVGSKQGVHWRIDDSAISINGSPVADVKAEDSLDIDVTQDGSPVGSWNGSAWIVPPCVNPSLTIGVYSDAGHTIPISTIPTDTTVYIRAVPSSGFTPDNYLFFSYDGTDLIQIGEQAGADISWLTLFPLTSGYVYAVAIDSVSGDKTWAKVAFDVTGDADASAFIAAASITDATQKAAIRTLVAQLKADLIWTKFHALYPLVGGTAYAHKFNLVNPLDTDAAFRLLFSGGVTHNSNGITGNGSNGTASTFYQPSTSATQNSASLSFYSRTNNTSLVADMDAGDNVNRFGSYVYGSNWYATINQSGSPASASGGSLGMFEASRVSSTKVRKRKNGAFVIEETETSNAPTSNILSLMNSGTSFYSNRNYAFFSIGTHLDDTESANFYSAVQAFQTTLGRNV